MNKEKRPYIIGYARIIGTNLDYEKILNLVLGEKI